MTTNPLCNSCKVQMEKSASVDSGNAKYVTYRCPTCHKEKTVCVGVNQ
jgi:hypothetical protein